MEAACWWRDGGPGDREDGEEEKEGDGDSDDGR